MYVLGIGDVDGYAVDLDLSIPETNKERVQGLEDDRADALVSQNAHDRTVLEHCEQELDPVAAQ